MAPKKRQSGSPLKDRLLEEFYRFSFFKAVDLLESLFPDKDPLGQTLVPENEAVRFSVKPGFVFPPSEIANIKQGEEDGPVEMEVAFMGLIGPSGVLPNSYNELAEERVSKKDTGLTSFFDIFHHRLISLFYMAWKKHQFQANYIPGAKDRLSNYLLSLSGLGTPGLTEMIGLPEESLTFCSGLLSRPAPSAAAIEATVGYLSGAETQVEQFIEKAIHLDSEDRTCLGMANSELGTDTVCGTYIWDCQATFRVNLGPMGIKDFQRFLPSGDMLGPVFSLIKYMVGMEFEFEVRIFLRKEEVPPCVLGAETPVAARLGWTTWTKSGDMMHEENPYITFQENSLMTVN